MTTEYSPPIIGESDTGLLAATIEQRLIQILGTLENNGIPYCIARNVDYIPHELIAHGDVDVVIPKTTKPNRLFKLLAPFGLSHYVHHRTVSHAYFTIVDDFVLHIDFRHGAGEWLGADYIPDSEFPKERVQEGKFFVASKYHQALLAWFDNILWGGRFQPKYSTLIQGVAADAPQRLDETLTRILGDDLGTEYLAFLRNGQLEKSGQLVRKTRRVVRRRSLRAYPLSTMAGLLNHFAIEIAFRLKRRPGGLSVALLGPDGAGKSSVADLLCDPTRERAFPFYARRRVHLFRSILPSPRDIRHLRWRPTEDPLAINTDPHGASSHGVVLASVRMLYFVLNSWLGELFWVRHRIAKNQLILFDRHITELQIDPARYRFNGPRSWAARIGRLAPQPDLFILLDAPADLLHQRKQEVPIAETARQVEAYRDLIRNLPNGIIVDASQPMDEVASTVRQVILRHLEKRMHHYMKLKGAS